MKAATLITDEGGLVFGVLVNLDRIMAEGKSGSCLEAHAFYAVAKTLLSELPKSEESWGDAIAWRNRLRIEVGAFRFVPRIDGDAGLRPHMEPADPGSRGSFIGAYWSEPL